MKEYDKAIADYDQAIRLQQRANYFTDRGDSYQFKGDLGAALDDHNTALRLDPNFPLAYNNRAVMYAKTGERAKALADYEAAVRLDPGNENAINGRRSMKAEIARFGSTSPSRLIATELIRLSIARRRSSRWSRRSAPIRSLARSTAGSPRPMPSS